MNTFYDLCFEAVRKSAEENGARTIDYDAVDQLVIIGAKALIEDPENPKAYIYSPPAKPRKIRKDKGTSKTNNAPFEEETTG